MKRNILSVALLLVSGMALAQVGIGVEKAHKSALLEVSANGNHYGGVLVPRVPLTSINDRSTINNGETANSLLVFNTTASEDLKPGFYYWFETRWIRMIADHDDVLQENVYNDEFAVDIITKNLYIKDTEGNIVDVPLADINILTTLEELPDGKFKYTSEDKTESIIDIPGTVINNIVSILEDNTVINEIYDLIALNGKSLTSIGNSIKVSGNGSKAVLIDTNIDIAVGGVQSTHIANETILNTDIHSKTIQATKLDAEEGVSGRVAVADAAGNVSFDVLDSSLINGEGSVSTDGIITVDNGTNKVLSDFALGIANTSITADKLSANGAAVGSVATVDANDKVTYKPLTSTSISDAKSVSTDGIIAVNGKVTESASVLKDIALSVKDKSITTVKLSSTENKLNAANGSVLVADGKGNTSFSTLDNVANLQGKDVTSDGSLSVLVDNKAVLKPLELKISTLGVKADHIQDKAVTSAKLWAGKDKENFVPVVQADGTVKYQALSSVMQEGSQLTIDNSLSFNGTDASKALLAPINLQINERGIQTNHIEFNAVTANKIGSENSAKGNVLVANGSRGTAFQSLDNTISPAMQGDITGSTTIVVENGDNTVFHRYGDDKPVAISLAVGGVESKHIADETILNANIHSKTIQAIKLDAEVGAAGRVAVADATGTVSFGVLDSSVINGQGTVSTDGIVTVDNGTNKVLSDFKLGIANTSVTADKLSGVGTEIGSVATVGANNTVNYELLKTSSISDAKSVTTDGIIAVNGKATESASVLKDIALSINDKSIDTQQIADNAVDNLQLADKSVTVGKINSGAVGIKHIIVSNDSGSAEWAELGDIVAKTSGDLTADSSIIKFTGNPIGSTLKNVGLDINDKSITKAKLSSADDESLGTNIAADRVMLTDGTGGFIYTTIDAVQAQGEDLKVSSALKFTEGNGQKAVLHGVSIDINEKGVSTAKLDNKAVTTAKMSSEDASANTVLAADGVSGVMYKEINPNVFKDGGVDLKSDASITVSGTNKALLQDATIAIAVNGVEGRHIKNLEVSTAKISSNENNTNAVNGSVLTADGKGNTLFSTLESLSTLHGKDVTSDGSLSVLADNKAVLKPLSLKINTGGVKNNHIGDKEVSPSKISSATNQDGMVLTANALGSTEFRTINTDLIKDGKKMVAGDAITITSGTNNDGDGTGALLKSVTVSLTDEGVTNGKIANKTVTADKFDAGGSAKGYVLTSLGDGEAQYMSLSANAGNLTATDNSIKVTGGDKVLLSAANIKVNDGGVLEKHIGDKEVTVGKLSSVVNDTNEAKDHVLVADGNGGVLYKELKSAMPKFFYMPSVYLDVTPNTSGNKNIYADYSSQFGSPMAVNPKIGTKAMLPILPASELNFFITYYDENVFADVKISDAGVLTYKVKSGAKITGKTYMNIVLEVRD